MTDVALPLPGIWTPDRPRIELPRIDLRLPRWARPWERTKEDIVLEAIAYNQKHSGNGTINSTGVSVAFGSGHAAGKNAYIAVVAFDSATDTPVMSDNDGTTTWVLLGTILRMTGTLSGQSLAVFWSPTTFSGTGRTITVKAGAGSYSGALAVVNVQGFTNTPAANGTPAYSQASGATVDTSNITTTVADAFLFAVSYPEGTTSALTTAGWTDLVAGGDGSWRGGDYGYHIVAATQTAVHATFTNSGGANGQFIGAISDGAATTTNPKTLTATEAQTATVARQDGKPLSATQAEAATVKRVVSKVLVP